MPLYEYQCDSCNHRFEIIQKFSDDPVSVCPKCGGPVTKLISSPAIQFKGTGWYITDYARKDQSANGGGGKKSNGSESGSSSSSEKTKDSATTSEQGSPAGSSSSSSGSSSSKEAGTSASKDS
jgi:putative FmdB family regulatory protein